jgi:hypothetical protein
MNNSSILILVLLLACGKKDNTSFGDADIVSSYRENLNSIITDISAVDVALRERAVGSANQATGENFSKNCLELDDQLIQVSILLGRMKPPSKLRELHSSIRQVVELRREACKKIVEGWKVEESESFSKADPLYLEAEEMLEKANQLLVSANIVLINVDEELAQYYAKRNPVS